MIQTTILLQQVKGITPSWTTSSSSAHEVKQWCLLLVLPLVGMLLLLARMLLQGVFAILGPLLIIVGAKLIAKRMEETPSGVAELQLPSPARC